MRRWSVFPAAACLLAAPWTTGAQEVLKPAPDLQARPEAMRWWREARFGLFIHWGPVSLKGTEISWSRGTGGIPVEEYDALYRRFDPVKFDAKAWVAAAKSAGMKYLVFTTKHHDGFSMFDSRLTDYKITNTPFGRDVTAELAKACHEAGLKLGFYYSPPDWHHPDYRTARHARYVDYMHGQVRELLTRYGRVDILWFDGLDTTAKENDADNLLRMAHRLQPGIVINNRSGLPADHDTPEQTVGRFQNTRPWESCITMGDQWAWKPGDRLKSPTECLQTLLKCAGGDGNLLFNVGPMPTGEIEPRQVERLQAMGAWLKRFGRSVYGTRGGPFLPAEWGVSTCRDRTIYLHILRWPEETLALPPLPRRIVTCRVLTGGRATVRQTPEGITLTVPSRDRQETDTLVALTLDGPAESIPPCRLPSRSLAFRRPATASNVHQKMPQFGPEKALDDDDSTRWATDWGTKEAWLEVDLGASQVIGGASIREDYGERVQEFALQHREGETWKTFARGTRIGQELRLAFPPVTARVVRLHILRATEGPTLSEFQLFAPKR